MTRHSPAAALSGAATLASLFLAGVTGVDADQPITEAAILADTDHDGVAAAGPGETVRTTARAARTWLWS